VNRTDTATRRATTAIVAAVALFAAGDSYSHIYDLAREHHQGAVSAALLPLAGDGLIAATRNGKDIPVRARVLLLAGIAATIAANVAYGLPSGIDHRGTAVCVAGRVLHGLHGAADVDAGEPESMWNDYWTIVPPIVVGLTGYLFLHRSESN
jgi:Protein of unknown function (DUF2637)